MRHGVGLHPLRPTGALRRTTEPGSVGRTAPVPRPLRWRRVQAFATLRGMAVEARQIRDVLLRDGSTLRLRPPRRGDAQAVLDFFGGLSQQSVYWRFHGFPA